MTASISITKTRIEAAMRAVDAGKEPGVRLRDARMAGLSLAIGRASARWALDFKVPLPGGGWSGGRRLVLGDLASMDLDAAREAAAAAKAQVAAGVDPAAAKVARRAANIEAGASQTVTAAIERFVDERGADWTRATHRAFARDFAIIKAAVGNAPMALVDRGRLVEMLADSIAPDGTGLRQATRIAGLLGSLWRQASVGSPRFAGWAWSGVDAAVADRLPVAGRHRIKARKRVLTEAEIRALWPALIAPGPLQPHRLVLALSLATGARIGAIALIGEADLDIDPVPIVGARDHGATFCIRAAEGRKVTAKARREGDDLVLPLSPLAVSLFREALAIRRGHGPHVFEARLGPLVSGDVTRAWGALVKGRKTPRDATAHDLRRSMRTHLGELDHGGSYEDEERLLGHKQGGAVAQAYDRGRRLARLRPLADAWGARLAAIVSAPPAKVLALADLP